LRRGSKHQPRWLSFRPTNVMKRKAIISANPCLPCGSPSCSKTASLKSFSVEVPFLWLPPSSRRSVPPVRSRRRSGSISWRGKSRSKDEVLAETDGEHIALEKSLGELWPRVGYRMVCGIKWWILSRLVGEDRAQPRAIPALVGHRPAKFYDWRQHYGRSYLTFMAHFRSIRVASTDQEFGRPDPMSGGRPSEPSACPTV
jgi:hypothetical protein